jgi:hypothetical protein
VPTPPDKPRSAARSGNPARRAGVAGPPTPPRLALESRSVRALVALNRLPRWLLIGAVLAVLVGGLILKGVAGALLLLVLAAFVGWLLAISWPVLTPRARLARLFVVLLVIASAVLKVVQHR